MKINQAQQILEKISYKNWKFYIGHVSDHDAIKIQVCSKVVDALSSDNYEVRKIINIIGNEIITYESLELIEEDHLIYTIFNICKKLELHELEEHFKIDNKCFRNPHPELDKNQKQ